jgi:hypothetical protein
MPTFRSSVGPATSAAATLMGDALPRRPSDAANGLALRHDQQGLTGQANDDLG